MHVHVKGLEAITSHNAKTQYHEDEKVVIIV